MNNREATFGQYFFSFLHSHEVFDTQAVADMDAQHTPYS